MTIVWILISSVAMATPAYALYAWIALKDLAARESHAEVFFRSARTMVKNGDTPVAVLRILAFLNSRLRRRAEVFSVLHLFWRGRISKGAGATSLAAELIAFKKAKPELGKVLDRSLAHGMLAVSYQDPIAGRLLRRYLLGDLSRHEERAQEIAAQLQFDATHCVA